MSAQFRAMLLLPDADADADADGGGDREADADASGDAGSARLLLERVHPHDRRIADATYQRALASGRPFSQEIRMMRTDGSVLEAVVTGEVLRRPDGAVESVWGTVQDVTGIRAAERAAKEAQAQAEVEHRLVTTFQRAMLPDRLPEVPGAEVAAAYLALTDTVNIGGDWYDVFVLPDGRTVLSIGDVAGHDLGAAIVMGQIRNALRAYAVEDPSPATVLARLNALVSTLYEPSLVTLMVGVYEPDSGRLVWARAGHPPPMVHGDRGPESLDSPTGPVLGAVAAVVFEEGEIVLEPGHALLWYTDGLVERVGEEPDGAVADLALRFAAALAADEAGPDRPPAAEVVASVTGDMLAGVRRRDDVCVLMLCRDGGTDEILEESHEILGENAGA
jgi:PAS domain-containing protein